MSSCAERSSLKWEKVEGAFVLYREGRPCGSMALRNYGYEVDVESGVFQLSKKGFIKPRLTIIGVDGRELGRVTGLNQFESKIEIVNGGCYLHRPLKEGIQNYAVFDCDGILVFETLNKSVWNSPSMHIDLHKNDLSDLECVYLAAISFFIFLDRGQGPSRLGDGTF